jgi:ADP-ribose pyrophosphatase YjhB (NUDIX family)
MTPRRVQEAGAIVFRLSTGAPEILLVRAKKDPTHWIFPKGHVELFETAEKAALREMTEEAGVVGRALREIGVLRFVSGKERVRTRYFLVEATGERTAKEAREKQWLAPAEALRRLTHHDARRLLEDALPDIDEEAFLAKGAVVAPDRPFPELLLAEYKHIADSLLHNEADGEKRAAFFISLVAATGGVLAFLLKNKDGIISEPRQPVVPIALLFVAAVGYLTFLRVVQRNLASDHYKRALNRIRRAFITTAEDPRRVFLAFDPFKREQRALPSWKSPGRGGWLQTVALIESLVVGAFVASLPRTSTSGCTAVVAGLAGLATWALLLWDASHRYKRAHRAL